MKTKPSNILWTVLIVVIITFQGKLLNAQPKEKEFHKMEYTKWLVFIPGNESTAPFYISTKPITNKEYILYLVWNARIYYSYPEVYMNALPGLNEKVRQYENFSPFSDSVSFKYYLENAESFVASYMFNPDYLNYPLIGISWEQANKFCHWLSDRYNEYSLIKKKHLMIDLIQRDEHSFSTESFIFGQYEGLVGKPLQIFGDKKTAKGFDYVNYYLRPSFHLATRNELKECCKMELPTVTKNLYHVFDKYSTDGSEFLKPFYENYLPEEKGIIYVNPDPYGSEN
ncbi:MAG: hypothetical protein AB9846_09545 [Tenuifilaceae bacterium]